MKNLIKAVLTVSAVLTVVFAGVRIADNHSCKNYGDITGREVKYSYLTCYVKTDRGFIPRDELNFRAATHE